MKVTVAIYEYPRGEDVRVFAAHESALHWRREIAAQFCRKEELSGEQKPSDPEQLADRYFEIMAEGDEYFRWEEYDVENQA